MQYVYPELCLSSSSYILSHLAAEERGAAVLEDLSQLLALLRELTEYKSNTVSFDRAHPLPTAYIVTPKFWNHYKNIDYTSVSLTEKEKQEDRKQRSHMGLCSLELCLLTLSRLILPDFFPYIQLL